MPAWQGTSTLMWTRCAVLRLPERPLSTCQAPPAFQPGKASSQKGTPSHLEGTWESGGSSLQLQPKAWQGGCVDFVLQGCRGMCTELTALRSSSSQNKSRTSALKLAALTARHLCVMGGQHGPHSCPPASPCRSRGCSEPGRERPHRVL